MTIGSGLRAPPTTLGSIARSKTPDNTPPSKGKEKVDASKKRKVAFEDVPISSTTPPAPQAAPSVEPSSSAGASKVDKATEVLNQLRQLPEKAGMSLRFQQGQTTPPRLFGRQSAGIAWQACRVRLSSLSVHIYRPPRYSLTSQNGSRSQLYC